jgi:hypothetical protein
MARGDQQNQDKENSNLRCARSRAGGGYALQDKSSVDDVFKQALSNQTLSWR